MKNATRRAAALIALSLGFIGCSTAPYKPAGLTTQQVSQKMNDLRQLCRTFRQGDYVSVKFYEGAPGVPAASLSGYFSAYNKMNDTISLSTKYLEYSDRGEPYSLA